MTIFIITQVQEIQDHGENYIVLALETDAPAFTSREAAELWLERNKLHNPLIKQLTLQTMP